MWSIAKIKTNEIESFKKNLKKKVNSDLVFYIPKIKIITRKNNKIYNEKIKNILQDYIFCFSKDFKKSKDMDNFKYIKGLSYFLSGHSFNQQQIVDFIKYCKKFQNEEGFIKPCFFKNFIEKKAKFISGPFNNMLFEIIEKQSKNLKILLGNLKVSVPNNNSYLYLPV
tara:strand:- start:76 stop:579 length:504 start_codon:yes stop_codon:yes gene_type:complete